MHDNEKKTQNYKNGMDNFFYIIAINSPIQLHGLFVL